jgi:hypothetical protein
MDVPGSFNGHGDVARLVGGGKGDGLSRVDFEVVAEELVGDSDEAVVGGLDELVAFDHERCGSEGDEKLFVVGDQVDLVRLRNLVPSGLRVMTVVKSAG